MNAFENQDFKQENEYYLAEEGITSSSINKSSFEYKTFFKKNPSPNTVYHLSKEYLGESVILKPAKVDDGEIDWHNIPYDYWDDAPYSPYTPRIDTFVVCFAPSPEKALLAIGKFKNDMEKDKFYIYGTENEKIPGLRRPPTYDVLDVVDTEELRTKESVPVEFLGYIEFKKL